jgi:hypothetical protein
MRNFYIFIKRIFMKKTVLVFLLSTVAFSESIGKQADAQNQEKSFDQEMQELVDKRVKNSLESGEQEVARKNKEAFENKLNRLRQEKESTIRELRETGKITSAESTESFRKNAEHISSQSTQKFDKSVDEKIATVEAKFMADEKDLIAQYQAGQYSLKQLAANLLEDLNKKATIGNPKSVHATVGIEGVNLQYNTKFFVANVSFFVIGGFITWLLFSKNCEEHCDGTSFLGRLLFGSKQGNRR